MKKKKYIFIIEKELLVKRCSNIFITLEKNKTFLDVFGIEGENKATAMKSV